MIAADTPPKLLKIFRCVHNCITFWSTLYIALFVFVLATVTNASGSAMFAICL